MSRIKKTNDSLPHWTSGSGVTTLSSMSDSLKKAEKLLRKGRLSIPHARYFVTCCTEGRGKTLTDPNAGEPIRFAWRSLHKEDSIQLLCATIMPDHVHFLFQLGSRLRLGQVVGKLKSMTRDSLDTLELTWQDNYHDHRLRADKAAESFSRYIFLNPYRSQLITENETWPWWTRNRDYCPEFMKRLDDPPRPPKEWLDTPASIESLIESDT